MNTYSISFSTDADWVYNELLKLLIMDKSDLEKIGFKKDYLHLFLRGCLKVSYLSFFLDQDRQSECLKSRELSSYFRITNSVPLKEKSSRCYLFLEYRCNSKEQTSYFDVIFNEEDASFSPPGNQKTMALESFMIASASLNSPTPIKEGLKSIILPDGVRAVPDENFYYNRTFRLYCERLEIPSFHKKDLMLYINYPVIFEYIKHGQLFK